MDELHFLTSSSFYQPRSCSVTRRERQSWTSVWLTSPIHLSSVTDWALNYHADPSHLAVPPLHICLSIRLYARDKAGLLISTQWSRLKVFTAKLCLNKLWLKEKPAIRPSFVTVRQGLCWIVGERLPVLMGTEWCYECKPKAPKRSSSMGMMQD